MEITKKKKDVSLTKDTGMQIKQSTKIRQEKKERKKNMTDEKKKINTTQKRRQKKRKKRRKRINNQRKHESHLLQASEEERLVEVEFRESGPALAPHFLAPVELQDASPLLPAHAYHVPRVQGDALGAPTAVEGEREKDDNYLRLWTSSCLVCRTLVSLFLSLSYILV